MPGIHSLWLMPIDIHSKKKTRQSGFLAWESRWFTIKNFQRISPRCIRNGVLNWVLPKRFFLKEEDKVWILFQQIHCWIEVWLQITQTPGSGYWAPGFLDREKSLEFQWEYSRYSKLSLKSKMLLLALVSQIWQFKLLRKRSMRIVKGLVTTKDKKIWIWKKVLHCKHAATELSCQQKNVFAWTLQNFSRINFSAFSEKGIEGFEKNLKVWNKKNVKFIFANSLGRTGMVTISETIGSKLVLWKRKSLKEVIFESTNF